MSLQYISGSLLTACLVLVITAPARADESRALHVGGGRGAVARPTSQAVYIDAPRSASSAVEAPSDLDRLKKVVFDLADEAVTGLMSTTIHLPFDMRVTPAAAVSWVKGLFGAEDSEPARKVAAVPSHAVQGAPCSAFVPCATGTPFGATGTPFFVHANNVANNVDGSTRVMKAVLRFDGDHPFDEELRWEDLRDELDAVPSSPSSVEIRLPALHVRERAQINSLLRVLHAG